MSPSLHSLGKIYSLGLRRFLRVLCTPWGPPGDFRRRVPHPCPAIMPGSVPTDQDSSLTWLCAADKPPLVRLLAFLGDDPGSCANSYVPKLYADTLVFYAALCAFTLGAAVFCSAQPLAAAGPPTPTPTPLARARALLLRRVRVPLARACGSWHPYPLGASVGELLLVGQVLALYAYWLWCWPS